VTTVPDEQTQSNGAAQPPAPAAGAGAGLRLEPGWDAALTYDVLDAEPVERPVFVGREDLLGSLVNAISQPDRRGTYLVSGYRGAGKTSLVIEAARRAQESLNAGGRELLPLVLNVSEVSASLEPASDTQAPPLGIDARRLLTALLRSLRNGLQGKDLHDGGELLARVRRACRKAEAAQYAERAQQRTESARSEVTTRTRSLAAPNVLKVVAAVAGLAFVGVESVALFGASTAALQTLALALAGGAVLSFTSSRTQERKASAQDVDDTELVFDNSLHQVETDLKEILAGLHHHDFRTMFVLEELDKVEDEEGQQLDAVIRYFKNLFTQAPALFFFMTDKRYFDLVDEKIATARASGSYAVEHTFFTHRLFVSRPALQECLDYFGAVLPHDDAAKEAIAHIRATGSVRYRPAAEMSPTEQFMRVLLFASQNHLFDLKNEMRRYVRVDEAGSRLEFDESSFPPHEQALAAFHFLLEQKADLYRFGGGRDYANEILRNCLTVVFADVGGDGVHRTADLHPQPGGPGAQLRVSERARIAEAVGSLLFDLERGRAIEPVVEKSESGDREAAFRWRADAAVAFAPQPRLETHEQALVDQLERASRICRHLAEGGPLAAVVGHPGDAERLAAGHAETIEAIRRALRPMSVEEAQQRAAVVGRELDALMDHAHQLHIGRLAQRGWLLNTGPSADASLTIVSAPGDPVPPRVVLVHGTDEPHRAPLRRVVAELPPGPVAVVLVDDDPAMDEGARSAVLERWRAAVAEPGREVLVTLVPLAEGLEEATAAETGWGEGTGDEIAFALLWTWQLGTMFPPPIDGDRPVWLRPAGGDEQRFDSLRAALEHWLGGADRVLAAPDPSMNDVNAIRRTFADIASGAVRPRLLLERSAPRPVLPYAAPGMDDDPFERLATAGRLLPLYAWGPQAVPVPVPARAVAMGPELDPELHGLTVSLLRGDEHTPALSGQAAFVQRSDPDLARALYVQAADAGDAFAIAELLPGLRSHEEVAKWTERLLATRDWSAVLAASDRLGGTAAAESLLDAATEAGFAPALARTLKRREADPETRDQLLARLLASGDWHSVRDAASNVADADLAAELLTAAARHGDTESMAALIVRGVPGSERWDEPFTAGSTGLRLWQLARDLDATDPDRGLVFHRAAAAHEYGDIDSMLEVLVRCAATDPEASRASQARLVERQNWELLRAAAERLRESEPERAAEIDALLPA
jgi:hypothetical protein